MGRGSRPDISIVVACYNAAQTVGETVASVRRQTHPDWELICIDDGSCDRTPQVLATLATEEPRLGWRRARHRGPSAARNHGTSLATGRNVLYLDADDVLRPDALEVLLRAARTANSETLVAGGWELLDPHGHSLGLPRFPAVREFTVDQLLLGNPISMVTLVPRHLLGPRPFDETLDACVDWDLWLRLAHRGAVCRTIPRVVFGYRLHASSLSRRWEIVYTSGRRVIERWLPHAHDPATARRAPGRWAVVQAALALAAGDTDTCARCTRELYHCSRPSEPAVDLAGALHYAFQFVRGRAGSTWAEHAGPWLSECSAWLARSPLAPQAARILAHLRNLIAAQADPLGLLRAAWGRRPRQAPPDRLVIYGLGHNGVALCERLRAAPGFAETALCGADDFADDLTFTLLDLPRVDPRQWRSWPAGTFVVVTPHGAEPLVQTLRAAGGRADHDFLTLVDSRPAHAAPARSEALV